jgi:hypothetical protein
MDALTGAQETTLKSHSQRVRCRFITFPVLNMTNVGSIASGTYTWSDLVNIFPRHSWCDNGGSLDLYGNDSLQHGGSAATGHSWTLTGESGGASAGTLSGTAGTVVTYSAPASGSGIDRVELQTDGSGSGNFGYIAYGADELNVGEVISYGADVESGGWNMTVKSMGDASGLERQKGILLVVDDYWNGSEDTFGGYRWSNGVFYGYVNRIRRVHEDAERTDLEIDLISPEKLLNYTRFDAAFFATSGSDEEIIISALRPIDVVEALMLESGINNRHNIVLFDDTQTVANLKLSEGPVWDVAADVAARTMCVIYSTRTGDIYVVPDPDIRWDEYEPGGPTQVLTFDTSVFEVIDVHWEDVGDPADDPMVPPDPTYGQVVLTGIKADLEEIWARWPRTQDFDSGARKELNGLICANAGTLEAWAARYYYKVQPKGQADISLFLMHHVDLYSFVGLTFTPDSDRLTNSGLGSFGDADWYVTSINYQIDPGMGTWRGGVHVMLQAEQSGSGTGENSSD